MVRRLKYAYAVYDVGAPPFLRFFILTRNAVYGPAIRLTGGAGGILSLGRRVCGRHSSKTGNANYKRSLKNGVASVCRRRKREYAPIRVHSFDGNARLVEGLRSAIAALASGKGHLPPLAGEDLDPRFLPASTLVGASWTVALAAFSEDGGSGAPGGPSVQFVQGTGEVGHLTTGGVLSQDARGRGGGTLQEVPLLSVDAWRERAGIGLIDVLKIDVEGHDVHVLRGAGRTLSAGLASVVMFEYHHKWPNVFTLASVVEWMANAGGRRAKGGAAYVCYLEGKHLLLRLTGCWDSKLELRRWSNVWCLHAVRASAVVAAFDAYSLAFLG